MPRRCRIASMASNTLQSRPIPPCSRSRCRSLFRKKRRDHGHERFSECHVLIGIQMDAVDTARCSHAPCVEEMAVQCGSDFAIGIREPAASLVRAQELRCDEALRRTDRLVGKQPGPAVPAFPARLARSGYHSPEPRCLERLTKRCCKDARTESRWFRALRSPAITASGSQSAAPSLAVHSGLA